MSRCHSLHRNAFAAVSNAKKHCAVLISQSDAVSEELFQVVAAVYWIAPWFPESMAVTLHLFPSGFGAKLEIQTIGMNRPTLIQSEADCDDWHALKHLFVRHLARQKRNVIHSYKRECAVA